MPSSSCGRRRGTNTVELRNPLPLGEGRVRVKTLAKKKNSKELASLLALTTPPNIVELSTEVGRNKSVPAGVSDELTGPMPETVASRPYSGLRQILNSTILGIGGEGCRRTALILFVAIALLLGMPDTAKACNTYYISTTGNDGNAGTISKPWATIAKASSVSLKPCDTVYIRGGTYNQHNGWFATNGTSSQPITIAGYSGDTIPIFDGTGISSNVWTPFFTLIGNYINLSGIAVRNGGTGIVLQGNNDTASNMLVYNIVEDGMLIQNGGQNDTIMNNTVYLTSLVNQGMTMKSSWGAGITAGNQLQAVNNPSGVVQNAVISGNSVYSVYGEGILSQAANGTIIENNTVYDNWATQGYVCNSTNVTFKNNLVYTTPQSMTLFGSGHTAALFSLADELTTLPVSANNTVINNRFLNENGQTTVAQISLFSWTLVSGSGWINGLFANNTIINGEITTGPINAESRIENNIFYRNDGGTTGRVPISTGLSFSNNAWYPKRPSNASGAGDVIADPKLALTGAVGPGKLTIGYFAVPSGSPAIGKGAAIDYVTGD